jgi:hypothetical protein
MPGDVDPIEGAFRQALQGKQVAVTLQERDPQGNVIQLIGELAALTSRCLKLVLGPGDTRLIYLHAVATLGPAGEAPQDW